MQVDRRFLLNRSSKTERSSATPFEWFADPLILLIVVGASSQLSRLPLQVQYPALNFSQLRCDQKPLYDVGHFLVLPSLVSGCGPRRIFWLVLEFPRL